MGGQLSDYLNGVNGFTPIRDFKAGLAREHIHQGPFKYYDRIRELGSGSIGAVMEVDRKPEYVGEVVKPQISIFSTIKSTVSFVYPTGPPKRTLTYAMKRVIQERVTPEYIEELKNEIEILRTLDHPNIIKLYETFDIETNLYLVMENCSGGDLWTRAPYTENEVALIVKKLTSVVTHMHESGITHRDLKMENVLFASTAKDAEIIVIDFGLSKKFKKGEALTSRVGSFYTMAPQVLQGEYTPQADMWALGVLTFILLANEKPFAAENTEAVIERIFKCDFNFDKDVWKGISQEAKDFVSQLLKIDPEERLTPQQVSATPWLIKQSHLKILNAEFVKDMQRKILEQSMFPFIKNMGLLVLAHNSTTQEISDLRKVFNEFDVDNDGKISLGDFQKTMGNYIFTDVEIKDFFNKLDFFGNGFVYFTEFVAATLEVQGPIKKDRIADAFYRVDIDASGYINKNNIKALLGTEYDEKMIDNAIKQLDKDGKGIPFKRFKKLFSRSISSVSSDTIGMGMSFDSMDGDAQSFRSVRSRR